MGRKIIAILGLAVFVAVVLVLGTLVRDVMNFKTSVADAIGVQYWTNSLYESKENDVKSILVRGVFLGYEKSAEMIGEYEYIGRAVFVGIDRVGKLFYYRVPLALRVGGDYYRSAQFRKSELSGKDGLRLIIERWARLEPGKTYSFYISDDVFGRFMNLDPSDLNVFENKQLEILYRVTSAYVNHYKSDLAELLGGDTAPEKIYNLIEMSIGQVEESSLVRVPFLLSRKYLTKANYE